jgi:hypothetical protein
MPRAHAAILCAAALLAAAGCGYTLGYPKAGPVGAARSVAIPIFSNATHEAGAEVLFTEALRREFALDPKTGVAGTGEAELVIKGSLAHLQSYPVSFLQGGRGLAIGEYFVTATVSVEARAKGRAAPVYANSFNASEQYLSANDPTATESNRRMAIGRLARRLMKDAHELMVAAF